MGGYAALNHKVQLWWIGEEERNERAEDTEEAEEGERWSATGRSHLKVVGLVCPLLTRGKRGFRTVKRSAKDA